MVASVHWEAATVPGTSSQVSCYMSPRLEMVTLAPKASGAEGIQKHHMPSNVRGFIRRQSENQAKSPSWVLSALLWNKTPPWEINSGRPASQPWQEMQVWITWLFTQGRMINLKGEKSKEFNVKFVSLFLPQAAAHSLWNLRMSFL